MQSDPSEISESENERGKFSAVLFCLLIAGLTWLSLTTWPLLDRTESRVVTIAQHMQDSSGWFLLEEPNDNQWERYWAKPPLHYWFVRLALSTSLPLDYAARLPALISLILILSATYVIADTYYDRRTARFSVLVLSTSALFFFTIPLALIDASLCATLTLALLTFLRAARAEEGSRPQLLYAAGVALGIGFCLKGPIALALPGFAGFLAILLRTKIPRLQVFDFVRMAVGCIAIALPILALYEAHNPGFLKYFLLSENLQRYLGAGYKPINGSVHSQPYGASLYFFLLGALPWSLIFVMSIYERVRRQHAWQLQWQYSFLLSWALSP
ncbi:MAG: glycosyltransferase family 39 protein, partial [Bdellovibrionales bacterium]|nr:glycosyltransferase family 39 protein [Bdellovibrionales bacterium]